MPPLEFVIPESFLFIPANLSFISFCFFISFIFFKLFRSKMIFLISLISLFSLVYNDVFIKYAIEQYYKLAKIDSTIYSYPFKNEEGKIDSLRTVKLYEYPLNSLSNLSYKEKEIIKKSHEEHVHKFIDIPSYTYKYNKYVFNQERLFLNIYKYDESFIEDKNEKARYTVVLNEKKSFFPELYKEFEYRFLDTKTNIVLATAFYIKFENSMNKLRNRFLYWNKEKEDMISFNSVENFDIIYKKLFIDEKEY